MSLLKLSLEEKSAFRRLIGSNDGRVLGNYLKECLEHQDKENRTTSIEVIQRGQGKSIILADLISKISQA